LDLAALQGLGLTRYESASYLALLGRDHATPTEVARLAGVPRPRVYDVLSSLAERRLARAVTEKPLRYAAEAPEVVMDRLARLRQEEAARAVAVAQECLGRLTPLYLAGRRHADPLDYVEVLRDSAEAARRINELWGGAEREVLVLVRPPYLAPPDDADEATVTSGIRQRAIYDRALLEDPRMLRVLRRYAELGESVRVAEHLPLKLTIIDARSVAFNMPDPVAADASVTTVVIHHEMLAATLMFAFEALWTNAATLDEAVD
jgi:sugar-specific transcriptional regulator TrmB